MTLAELGQELKSVRENKGLSLDDIAEKIKVSVRILRLIEEGSTQGLPHAVYSRGFILSYAGILEYDKEQLRAHLNELFPSEDMEEVKPMPGPITSSGHSSGMLKRIFVLLLLLAFLAGLVWGGWFIVTSYGTTITDWVKRPFSAISEPLQQQDVVATTEPSPSAAGNALGATQSAGSTGSSQIALGGATSTGQGSSQPVTIEASPQASAQETTAVATLNEHELVINAKSRCWVRYLADDGAGIELTIKPGDSQTLTYKTSMKITLGNPSGVELLVDGKAYEGELRSNRPITIEFP